MPDLSLPAVVVERRAFILKMYPGSEFAEFIIRDNAVLDDKAAHESRAIFQTHAPGKKFFLLVSSEGFMKVTKKARRLGADRVFSSHLAAVSCYTNNASLALLGELYNKLNKPAVTTKMFSNREVALEWLLEQMQASSPGADTPPMHEADSYNS